MGETKRGLSSVISVIFSTIFLLVIIVMIWYVVIPWIQFSIIDSCWAEFASQTGSLASGIYMYGYKNVTLDFGSCSTGLFFLNKGTPTDPGSYDELKKITRAAESEIRDYERNIPIYDTIFDECNEEKVAFMIATPWFGEKMELGGPLIWIMGGAVVGAWYGGKIPKIGGIMATIGGALGMQNAERLRQKTIDHFAAIEERGKHSICFSLDKPFDRDFDFVPGLKQVIKNYEDDTDDEDKKKYFEPYAGKMCVLLFKGEETYHMQAFEGTCGDNRIELLETVESLKEGG